MLDAWPDLDSGLIDPAADTEINRLIEMISESRSVRAEMNVPAGAEVPLIVVGADDDGTAQMARNAALLTRLARLSSITHEDAPPADAVQIVVGEATLALPLAGVIDIAAEKARLEKEIAKQEGEIRKISGKLSNEGFLAKAPAEVIEENRARLAEEEAKQKKLAQALARLAQI